MRGGRKWAKPACGRPLEGRVRHLAEKRHIRPCAQQGDCAATGKCVDVHERHSVRDLDERGNSELHCPGKTCMSSAFGWTCRELRYLRWPPQDGHPRRTAFRLLRARRLEGGGEAASAVPLRLARPRLKAFCLPGVSKVLVPCRLKVARDERRGAGAVAVSAARSGRIAMLRFTTTVTAHFCSRTRGPNVEVSGGLKAAKQALGRPLDRRVRAQRNSKSRACKRRHTAAARSGALLFTHASTRAATWSEVGKFAPA